MADNGGANSVGEISIACNRANKSKKAFEKEVVISHPRRRGDGRCPRSPEACSGIDVTEWGIECWPARPGSCGARSINHRVDAYGAGPKLINSGGIIKSASAERATRSAYR
ncbi:hypothetical protein EVAR_75385_1 [Eumeta japonica]|uniref:Uncharacterized protein n=1 Tax=Eumeta variegata TaxID=151549 RepID=A0A4C1TJR2_EUMVA|nr:hypothetical protein EVAR_75385_1 [Eumeta japonica]